MRFNKRWLIDGLLLIFIFAILFHLMSMERGPIDQLIVAFSALCIGFTAGYHSNLIADFIFGKEVEDKSK